MEQVVEKVEAILRFVRHNAPTMPELFIQRIGLIVGFDPDDFPEEKEVYSETFESQVQEAAKKVLNMEKLELGDGRAMGREL